MDCSTVIPSEETYEFIVAADEAQGQSFLPECIQRINSRYSVWYYNRAGLPRMSVDAYTYSAIPKCFGLVESTGLEVSGILKLQNQPALSLNGQGVFIAVIDTGIRIADDAFRSSDGSTRIFSVWDQTQTAAGAGMDGAGRDGIGLDGAGANGAGTSGTIRLAPPEGFLYGVEYSREQINAALRGEDPDGSGIGRDENGHGTFLASLACGSRDARNGFTGAAPYSELIVVKLKEAKRYLREFYFIPEDTPAYAESDIMAAVSYADGIARREGRPLVIFLGLGTNNGNHAGSAPLCSYLDELSSVRHRAVVAASGNEAGRRHHFSGMADSIGQPYQVEINVEADIPGFYAEIWVPAPELSAVSVQSPTGEVVPKSIPAVGGSRNYTFVFENTKLSIDYRTAGNLRRDQLIFLRFTDVVRGIWVINVYPKNLVNGNFNIWLPMSEMLSQDVFFLKPDPKITLTMPSDSRLAISVGGYNSATESLYLDSGRGFTADGVIKPDFLAPAVNLLGKGLRGGYVDFTGTSAASAITAGACAQILEWAVTRGNAVGINSVDIRNLLIRGCERNPQQEYPSPEQGFGYLDVYRAFLSLR